MASKGKREFQASNREHWRNNFQSKKYIQHSIQKEKENPAPIGVTGRLTTAVIPIIGTPPKAHYQREPRTTPSQPLTLLITVSTPSQPMPLPVPVSSNTTVHHRTPLAARLQLFASNYQEKRLFLVTQGGLAPTSRPAELPPPRCHNLETPRP